MAAVAAAGAERNVPERSWMRTLSSRAQHSQAEPGELQPSACREVRESNIPLELCVYTAWRKGELARGCMRALQEGKQINSKLNYTNHVQSGGLLQRS